MTKAAHSWQLLAIALGLAAIGLTVWIARSELSRSTTTCGAEFSGVTISGEWLEGGVLSNDELHYLQIPGEEFFVTADSVAGGSEVAWTGDCFTTAHVKIPFLGVSVSPPKLIDVPGNRWTELPPEVAALAATPEELWENGQVIRSWAENSAVAWQPVPPSADE